MTETDIIQALTRMFHDVFDDDSITLTPETTANDVDGWDSQTHVTLIVAAEQHFGVRFRTAELESLRNVGHFVQLIGAKLTS